MRINLYSQLTMLMMEADMLGKIKTESMITTLKLWLKDIYPYAARVDRALDELNIIRGIKPRE